MTMAGALQRDAVVGPDGTIAVRVPELAAGQRVRVLIELEESIRIGHAIDVLAEVSGHRLFKSADEVDAYIQAERAAWER
jgi:hypothetical protein